MAFLDELHHVVLDGELKHCDTFAGHKLSGNCTMLHSPARDDGVELARDPPAGDRGVGDERQAFPGILLDIPCTGARTVSGGMYSRQ